MRHLSPFVAVIILCCVLAAGCAQPTPQTDGNTSLTRTFASFTVPGTEGSLMVVGGGLGGEYPVTVNGVAIGTVSATRPLLQTMPEGTYTVKVCCGTICEEENVTIEFAKKMTVDLSEDLAGHLGSPRPSVHLIGYYLNAHQLTVNVEFINPTTAPVTMAAEVSCGYTYIEGRTNSRLGSMAQGHLSAVVDPCGRAIRTMDVNLASGSGYIYDAPTVLLTSPS